jgi:O-antigen ligase
MPLIAFMIAIAAGFLLHRSEPPDVRMINQLMTAAGWGVVLCLLPAPLARRKTVHATIPLLVVLAVLGSACAVSWTMGLQSRSPSLLTLATLALAALLVLHGAAWGEQRAVAILRWFAVAILVAGLGNAAMAIVQFLVPDVHPDWILADSAFAGRSAGYMAQPNHLALFLVWALTTLPVLALWRPNSRPVQQALMPAGLLLLEGVVLSGSRAGLLCILFLVGWGALGRGLQRPVRLALLATPVAALALWAATKALALWLDLGYIGVSHDAKDPTSFRFEIWRNAWTMISAQPWLGVGWGQFNFAWTLTPISYRPAGFVGNAHNLFIHLGVELGVPLALASAALLLFAAWKAVAPLRCLEVDVRVHAAFAVVMVAVIGLGSMLEYPLWYTYFLFPVAWLWGFLLGAGASGGQPAPALAPAGSTPAASGAPAPLRLWRVLGAMMIVAALSAWADYLNVTAIYLPAKDAPEFAERVRRGQESPLFARYADFTAAMATRPYADALPAIRRSAHVLLDAKLMFVWANALAQTGEVDKARYLLSRLQEFHTTDLGEFMAPCRDASVATKPFQCEPPAHGFGWRDFE